MSLFFSKAQITSSNVTPFSSKLILACCARTFADIDMTEHNNKHVHNFIILKIFTYISPWGKYSFHFFFITLSYSFN